MNQHDPLALHAFCGWLAYVLFLTDHLNACEKISLLPHAHLSSWCLWYGLMTWSSLLMFKYLGKFIWKKNLQSSSLVCQSPTKATWWVFLKNLSTYATCFLVELSLIVVTHIEIHFILLWSRSRTRPFTCYFLNGR